MDNIKWCVYKHTSPNGKIYIGITHLKLSNRWRSKGQGYKRCPYFYNAIQKYGWENFKHEVILDNLTQRQAYEKEIELIKYFNSIVPNGYNIDTGGYSGTKFKKAIIEISETGEIKHEFNSITEAAYFLNCDPSSISKALNRKGRCKNRIFIYKNDLVNGKIILKDYVKNYIPNRKQIYQYDFISHKFISKYNNINEAAKKTNTNRSDISFCITGKNKSANGFIWSSEIITDFSKYIHKRILNTKPVSIIKLSMTGDFIKRYNTIGEAAKENNLYRSGISACICKKTNSCGGYKWKKEDEYI